MTRPAIWWWVPITDDAMDAMALASTALSVLVALGGQSWLIMLVLWLMYFSIVHTGDSSSFYQYGKRQVSLCMSARTHGTNG